jgi:hypothetical protein
MTADSFISKAAPGRVLIINDRRFYSPNSQRDVRIPPDFKAPKSGYFDGRSRLADFQEPRWLDPVYGFICMTPLRPTFKGPLFDVLHSFPYIEKLPDQTWILPQSTIQDWQMLEHDLNNMLEALGSLWNGYRLGHIPPPSSFGYCQAHRTEQIARRQAIISRDWFVMYIGALSYLLHGAGFRTGSHWYQHVVSRGFSEKWLGSLQASDAYVKNTERVGAFFVLGDKSRGDFPELTFLRDLVPIWYPWENREEELMKKHSQLYLRFIPSEEQLANPTILNFYDDIPHSIVPSGLTTSQFSERPGTPPNPRSGQKPGQTLQDFFQARKQALRPESLKQREDREFRERNPVYSGAAMFEWLKNSAGDWIRHPRLTKDFDNLRLLYEKDERKYDALRNEWDFCEAFSRKKKKQSPVPDDCDGSDDDGYWWYPSTASFVEAFNTPVDATAPDPSLRPEADLLEFLRSRYGFVVPIIQPDPPIQHYTIGEWNKAMLCFGLKDRNVSDNELANDAIVEFAATSTGTGPDGGGGVRVSSPLPIGRDSRKKERFRKKGPANVPRRDNNARPNHNLSDLQPDNHYYLPCVRDLRREVSSHISFRPLHHLFILSDTPDTPWTIALTSSTDVLHSIRANCSGRRELARLCLSMGVPFRTFVRLTSDWRPQNQVTRWDRQHIPFVMDIPYRSVDYQYTPADYSVYEAQRARLLAQPHALAARKLGGIVWRLSRDYMTDEEVLEGPSDTSKVYGFGLLVDDPRTGQILCDDELSEEEVGLICGLHVAATGTISHSSLSAYTNDHCRRNSWPKIKEILVAASPYMDVWDCWRQYRMVDARE